MISGVPAHVDGRMLDIAAEAGGRLVNRDRMWHYTEGLTNWDPIWPHARHPHPARPVVALARRHRPPAPVPLYPGFDTLGTLAHLRRTGHDHSWFVLTQKIIEREFALSGSEQNPDLTGKDLRAHPRRALPGRARPGRGVHRGTARTSSSPTTCTTSSTA